MDVKMTYMFERDWTTCSTFVNRSRFNSQHNWGTIRAFNELENLHFDNK